MPQDPVVKTSYRREPQLSTISALEGEHYLPHHQAKKDPSQTRTKLPSWRRHGGNQQSMGQYNERLVISLLRRLGGATKAELARHTGLSPQAVTGIIERLLKQDMVHKGSKNRGRIGQPSTMFHLSAQGSMAIGIKIGRRSLNLILMGLDGSVLDHQVFHYPYPDPQDTLRLIEAKLLALMVSLDDHIRARLIGIGVAMPRFFSGWETAMNIPSRSLKGWEDIDIAVFLHQLTGLHSVKINDVSAACLAEHCLGIGQNIDNFLYIYFGSFIGGGLILDGELRLGAHNNAADIAAMHMVPSTEQHGAQRQLIDVASLIRLENMFRSAGITERDVFDAGAFTPAQQEIFQQWQETACDGVALCALHAAAMLDLQAVIIDSALDNDKLAAIVATTQRFMQQYNVAEQHVPEILQGTQGHRARALGGAFLPLALHFEPKRQQLLIE